MNPRGDPPAAAATTDEEPKVADPSIPGRMVSAKKANQPFLACVRIPAFTQLTGLLLMHPQL